MTSLLIGALALPGLLVAGYLLLLALCSARRPAPVRGKPQLRFDLVVPAHDEEAGITRTVRSLLAVDYPASLRRVLVVADNCSDATAARARIAGARVLVRDEAALRGKGYALAHAFEQTLRDGFADAVIVVDADSVVAPNLLDAFSARLSGGAQAVQAASSVLNANDSWRTQLMALGFALFNRVRSLARENLGLSCGLRGNGMCFSTALLRMHPAQAFSIVEDLEYGLALGRAGVRVHYADEASVASAMVSAKAAAGSQRRRWELGRFALARRLALPLLRDAARSSSPLLLDLALDLLVPPLSFVVLYIAAGLAVSALACGLLSVSFLWLTSATFVAAYVARGWVLSGIGVRGLLALRQIPRYLVWKTILLLKSPEPGGWVRTAREEALP